MIFRLKNLNLDRLRGGLIERHKSSIDYKESSREIQRVSREFMPPSREIQRATREFMPPSREVQRGVARIHATLARNSESHARIHATLARNSERRTILCQHHAFEQHKSSSGRKPSYRGTECKPAMGQRA